ncbi:MAG TPA: flagellar hook-associated protein FlgK [Tepidisphaeraceae bacterium]|jgi:flagellar hook-associated protein 1 FlgK
MSLNGLLNIGGTALAVNTSAIQTTGNNIANVGNADYTRQSVKLGSTVDTKVGPGQFVGNGVRLDGIARQINEALEARLRGATSDGSSANARQDWLGRVESVFNELSDSDLSTKLSTFFKGWSDLANKPQDAGLRQVVLQNATSVTEWFHQIDNSLDALQGDLNNQVKGLSERADHIAGEIAKLNARVTAAEGGNQGASANGLRDQRDALIKELSGLMDIQTVQTSNGSMNVYVGSEPLVFNAQSSGITSVQKQVGEHTVLMPAFKKNNGVLKLESGQLGALGKVGESIRDAADHVDSLASSLSFELNKIHSSGQGLAGLPSVIGSASVIDSTKPLTSPDAGLEQLPANGSFVVHVKDKATGLSTSTLVKLDLNGDGSDTTFDSLIAQINAVDGVTAVNNGGRLQMSADDAPQSELTFSQDSSGVLAALGINTFFSGTDARSIDIAASIKKDINLIAAARNGDSGDNQTALAIAKLESTSVTSLRGATMKDSYGELIGQLAAKTSQASTDVQSTDAVTQTLQNQREMISGVSMDEEAVNLMRYQRAYQGAARLVTVVDELMDTMMNMVR